MERPAARRSTAWRRREADGFSPRRTETHGGVQRPHTLWIRAGTWTEERCEALESASEAVDEVAMKATEAMRKDGLLRTWGGARAPAALAQAGGSSV